MTAPISRAQYVAMSANIFSMAAASELTLKDLEEFANGAEETASERDREVTEYLIDDEHALTNHAAHIRTLVAKIVFLRDGLVPALKIDWHNPTFRMLAVQSMGYIRAEFEAMTLLLR